MPQLPAAVQDFIVCHSCDVFIFRQKIECHFRSGCLESKITQLHLPEVCVHPCYVQRKKEHSKVMICFLSLNTCPQPRKIYSIFKCLPRRLKYYSLAFSFWRGFARKWSASISGCLKSNIELIKAVSIF